MRYIQSCFVIGNTNVRVEVPEMKYPGKVRGGGQLPFYVREYNPVLPAFCHIGAVVMSVVKARSLVVNQ
jgi:hypothetical protein